MITSYLFSVIYLNMADAYEAVFEVAACLMSRSSRADSSQREIEVGDAFPRK